MTQKKKIEVYERVLHNLQMHYEVTGNHEQVKDQLSRICTWSYAHRAGNGMLTERQQNKLIRDAFNRLI